MAWDLADGESVVPFSSRGVRDSATSQSSPGLDDSATLAPGFRRLPLEGYMLFRPPPPAFRPHLQPPE